MEDQTNNPLPYESRVDPAPPDRRPFRPVIVLSMYVLMVNVFLVILAAFLYTLVWLFISPALNLLTMLIAFALMPYVKKTYGSCVRNGYLAAAFLPAAGWGGHCFHDLFRNGLGKLLTGRKNVRIHP